MTRHDTPGKATGMPSSAPCKKNSDSKKAWKNRIRQACLSRVRRQCLSGNSANSNMRGAAQNYDNDDRQRSIMMTQQQDHHNGGTFSMDSRSLVEAELKLHGVRVVSPPSNIKWISHQQQEQQQQSTMMMMDCGDDDGDVMTTSNDAEGFFLTEDEVFELMEEIEREWKQHEERLLEEEMDRIENEEQALYDTIADYEQWAEDAAEETTDAVILCPLCQEVNLTTSHTSEMGDDIVCPNHMDGSCTLRLEARSGLCLPSLKGRLAQAIATHAELCSHSLRFELSHEMISDDSSMSLLWGTCSLCGTRSCVA